MYDLLSYVAGLFYVLDRVASGMFGKRGTMSVLIHTHITCIHTVFWLARKKQLLHRYSCISRAPFGAWPSESRRVPDSVCGLELWPQQLLCECFHFVCFTICPVQ